MARNRQWQPVVQPFHPWWPFAPESAAALRSKKTLQNDQITPETLSKIETRAQALVNAMAKREYQNAGAHFDANMTSIMPTGKIEEFWTSIQEKIGPFVEQVSGSVTNAGATPVVVVVCKFEKQSADIYVTFDAASNVCGLHVGPAPAAAEAVTLNDATAKLAGAALERARAATPPTPTEAPAAK